MSGEPLRILAISGSLRIRSTNTELLRAAALLAAPSLDVFLYGGLSELPHFNPDLDGEGVVLPHRVRRLRGCIASADALLISSPEYAHGVPGSLKNALDWLVSGPEMIGKPVGLLTASARAVHAPTALAETLRTMAAELVAAACVLVPLDGRCLDAAAIVADPALTHFVRPALDALAAVARSRRAA
ncbi:MAG: NADPH-dependent FMN reductase [Gemmatimonadaceae bacterium]